MTEVLIVDHGAGNLRSLRAAFARLGVATRVSDEPADVRAARRIVLPGVGSAGPAMARLRERRLDRALAGAVEDGAFVLGVCLGMQLLFEASEEGGARCLGMLPGRVRRMAWAARVPHMGWNDVSARAVHPLGAALPAVCYFAHSYACDASTPAVVAASDLEGRDFPSLVAAGRVAGVQFHPERSGPDGRALLAAFLAWSADAA